MWDGIGCYCMVWSTLPPMHGGHGLPYVCWPDWSAAIRRYGLVVVWYDIAWYNMIWYGMVWYCMLWHVDGMVRYDKV